SCSAGTACCPVWKLPARSWSRRLSRWSGDLRQEVAPGVAEVVQIEPGQGLVPRLGLGVACRRTLPDLCRETAEVRGRLASQCGEVAQAGHRTDEAGQAEE